MPLEIIVALVAVVAVALLIILIRTHGNFRSLRTKYAAIIDIDAEVQKRTGERDTIVKDTEKLPSQSVESMAGARQLHGVRPFRARYNAMSTGDRAQQMFARKH